MNIIINKPQLVRAVLLYLNKNFGSLTQKTSSKYPDSVFYVDSDNEVLMEYDKKNNDVRIHYGKIWSKIASLFYLNYADIQSIMKHWLEEAYKLKGITPRANLVIARLQLEEAYKLKGITPPSPPIVTTLSLEEAYKLKGITPFDGFGYQNLCWRRLTN